MKINYAQTNSFSIGYVYEIILHVVKFISSLHFPFFKKIKTDFYKENELTIPYIILVKLYQANIDMKIKSTVKIVILILVSQNVSSYLIIINFVNES